MKDLRERIGHAVTAAKIDKRVTPHTFRHTYAAARLQTLDHGAPVSPYTVTRELGHSSIQLLERTYGHLMHTRHRAQVVEYKEAKVVPVRRTVPPPVSVVRFSCPTPTPSKWPRVAVSRQPQTLLSLSSVLRGFIRVLAETHWTFLSPVCPRSCPRYDQVGSLAA